MQCEIQSEHKPHIHNHVVYHTHTLAPALCNSSTCLNGGTCLHPGHNCTCRDGWIGNLCEQSMSIITDTCITKYCSPNIGIHNNNIIVVAVSVVVVVVVLMALGGVLLGVALMYRQRKNTEMPHDIIEMSTIDLTRYCIGPSGFNAVCYTVHSTFRYYFKINTYLEMHLRTLAVYPFTMKQHIANILRLEFQKQTLGQIMMLFNYRKL